MLNGGKLLNESWFIDNDIIKENKNFDFYSWAENFESVEINILKKLGKFTNLLSNLINELKNTNGYDVNSIHGNIKYGLIESEGVIPSEFKKIEIWVKSKEIYDKFKNEKDLVYTLNIIHKIKCLIPVSKLTLENDEFLNDVNIRLPYVKKVNEDTFSYYKAIEFFHDCSGMSPNVFSGISSTQEFKKGVYLKHKEIVPPSYDIDLYKEASNDGKFIRFSDDKKFDLFIKNKKDLKAIYKFYEESK